MPLPWKRRRCDVGLLTPLPVWWGAEGGAPAPGPLSHPSPSPGGVGTPLPNSVLLGRAGSTSRFARSALLRLVWHLLEEAPLGGNSRLLGSQGLCFVCELSVCISKDLVDTLERFSRCLSLGVLKAECLISIQKRVPSFD